MKRIKSAKALIALIPAVLLVLSACSLTPAPAPTPNPAQPPAGLGSDAKVALDWMKLIGQLVEANGVSATESSRICAYAAISLYESALPGMPGYRTLAGQLNDLPPMPQPEPGLQYDWSSSITGALATTIRGLFDSASEETLQAISSLQDSQLKSREATVPSAVVSRSVAYGELVGNAILSWADQDGYRTTRGLSYTPPTGPRKWAPTPPGYKPAFEPYWGELRTFVLDSAAACPPVPPIPYSTEPTSAFYQQAWTVYQTVTALDKEQTAIARYWADEGLTTPCHWLSIENQIVAQLEIPLDRAAELYALVGVAMGDAFIACWHTKYQWNVLRPVTYINQQIDPKWQPLLPTPSFPEYTSAHAVVSGAAATVLSRMLGKVTFSDATYLEKGMDARSYDSFEAMAEEAAMSRLYGGIHYPMGNENGLSQGQCVGQTVLAKVQTLPR